MQEVTPEVTPKHVPNELLVLQKLTELAKTLGFSFSKTAIVGVQHILKQIIPLAFALEESGLQEERGWIVGKVYSTMRSVVNTLRDDHPSIRLFETNEGAYQKISPFSGQFAQDVQANWDAAEVALLSSIESGAVDTLLVFDDGGNATTEAMERINRVSKSIARNDRETLDSGTGRFWQAVIEKNCRLAAVEQTSAGVHHIIEYIEKAEKKLAEEQGIMESATSSEGSSQWPPLMFPIVLAASSALKVFLESKLIAEHFLEKFEACFGERIRGVSREQPLRLGLIGLGNIGHMLSEVLGQHYPTSLRIRSYDRDVSREARAPMSQEQPIAPSHADELPPIFQLIQSSDVVMGCTGTDVFRPFKERIGPFFSGLDHDIEFFSVSSENIEFLQLILSLNTMRDNEQPGSFQPASGLLDDIHYQLRATNRYSVTIHYRGYPFNFKNSQPRTASEPMDSAFGIDPNRFQFMIGALYGSLIQAQGSAVALRDVMMVRGEPIDKDCFLHQFDPCLQRFILNYAFRPEVGGLKAGEYLKDTLRRFDDVDQICKVSDYLMKQPIRDLHLLDSRAYGINYREIRAKALFRDARPYQAFCSLAQAAERAIDPIRFEHYGFSTEEALVTFYRENPYNAFISLLSREPTPIEDIYCRLAVIREDVRAERDRKFKAVFDARGSKGSFIFSEYLDQLYKKQQGKLVGLEQLFIPPGEIAPKKKILIVGSPGVGKSTFCQRIAFLWASHRQESQYWLNRFSYCFRIPLRELSNCEDCGSKGEVIKKLFFSTNPQVGASDIEFLFTTQSDRILLLLDGLDETVTFAEHSQARKLRDDFMGQSACSVVVTSRPYHLSQRRYDLRFEIIGYTEEDIRNYVMKYFREGPSADLAKQLLEAIHSQPYLQSIARVPLLLQLICLEFRKNPTSSLERLNLTDLYDRLYVETLRENLSTRARGWFPSLLAPGNLDSNEILTCSEPITNFFERISFEALAKQTAITPALFQQTIQKIREMKNPLLALAETTRRFLSSDIGSTIDIEQLIQKTLQASSAPVSGQRVEISAQGMLNQEKDLVHGVLSCGLLAGDESECAVLEKNYYFQHLTFQEYFAARYFANQWQDVTRRAEARGFLEKNRTNPSYEVMWCFVSGILKESDHWPAFMEALWEETHIPSRFYLLVRCIEESGNAERGIAKKYINWIAQVGKARCFFGDLGDRHNSRVLTALMLSPQVLKQAKILDSLSHLIQAYGTLGVIHREAGQDFFDDDNEERRHFRDHTRHYTCNLRLMMLSEMFFDSREQSHPDMTEEVTEYLGFRIFDAFLALETFAKLNQDARKRLLELCDNPNHHIRSNALRSLRLLPDEDVRVKEKLLKYCAEGYPEDRFGALMGVSKLSLHDEKAKQFVIRCCQGEPSMEKYLALHYLGKIAQENVQDRGTFLKYCKIEVDARPHFAKVILKSLGKLVRVDGEADDIFFNFYKEPNISSIDSGESIEALARLATGSQQARECQSALERFREILFSDAFTGRYTALDIIDDLSYEHDSMRDLLYECCRNQRIDERRYALEVLGRQLTKGQIEPGRFEEAKTLFLEICPSFLDETAVGLVRVLGKLSKTDERAKQLFYGWHESMRTTFAEEGDRFFGLGELAKDDPEIRNLLLEGCKNSDLSCYFAVSELRELAESDPEAEALFESYCSPSAPQYPYAVSVEIAYANDYQKDRERFFQCCLVSNSCLSSTAISILGMIALEDERAQSLLFEFCNPEFEFYDQALRALQELAKGDEMIGQRLKVRDLMMPLEGSSNSAGHSTMFFPPARRPSDSAQTDAYEPARKRPPR